MKLSLIWMAVATLGLAQTPNQSRTYDPEGDIDPKTFSCEQLLTIVEEDEARSSVFVVWAHGYNSGLRRLALDQLFTGEDLDDFGSRLTKICRSDPKKLFVKAAAEIR